MASHAPPIASATSNSDSLSLVRAIEASESYFIFYLQIHRVSDIFVDVFIPVGLSLLSIRRPPDRWRKPVFH
jgi:hypothetical protein